MQGDNSIENYQAIARIAKTVKGVPGLTLEIGLRDGYGSLNIMRSFVENDDRRTHISLDPFGSLPYSSTDASIVYPNELKRRALAGLYPWCHDHKQDFLFFQMEDTEFFSRFSDGVPVYTIGKEIVNRYAFVSVDGAHTTEAVMKATEFLMPRTDAGAVITYDNLDWYDHSSIHAVLTAYRYVLEETLLHNKAVVYRRK